MPPRRKKPTQLSAAAAKANAALGPLVMIGGRFEDDNRDLFGILHKLSGGVMAVFGTASLDCEEVGREIADDFRKFGIRSEYAPLMFENRQRSGFDGRIVEQIDRAGGVYFSGGDQLRIRDSLIQNGQPTPVLEALHRLRARGGLISGSSAGAAMQSDPMILGGSSLEALTIGRVDDPDDPGISFGKGLGFFPWGLVDQHFIERGRIGRLVAALRYTGQRWGFGVDENTAMIAQGNVMRCLGETGFVVIDMAQAQHVADGSRTSGIRVSYVDHGDKINLRTGRVSVAKSKKLYDAGSSGFRRSARRPRDAFGAYAMHEIWQRLAMGDIRDYKSQSVTAGDPGREAAVRLTLSRVTDISKTYRDRRGRLTMANFLLSMELEGREPDLGQAMAVWADVLPTQLVKSQRTQNKSKPTPTKSVKAPMKGALPSHIRRGIVITGRDINPVLPARAGNMTAYFGSHPPEKSRRTITQRTIDCGGKGRPADNRDISRLAEAKTIQITTGDRRHMLARVTHMGENSPLHERLDEAVNNGAILLARGEAVPALGHDVITYGDARSAIRWGVSSDAGIEGLVLAQGFGLIPGLIETGIDRPGHLGRMIIACGERRITGWGLPDDGGIEFDLAAGQAFAIGDRMPLVVSVDPAKMHSTRKYLDIRDALIRPAGASPGSVFDMEFEQAGQLNTSAERDRIISLIDAFAAEIGATPENNKGTSWSGTEILMRAHNRENGAVSLDISCHRDRLTARIR